MRVVKLTAVGYVEAPDRERGRRALAGLEHPGHVDGDAQRARLYRGGLSEAGLVRKVIADVRDGEAGGDGDPVPLVEAVDGHLVAGLLKGGGGELVGPAFDLLHGEDVRV